MAPDQSDAGPPIARETAPDPSNCAHPYAVAHYVAEIAPQLAKMAKSAKLSNLAYLLGMAALDASNTVKEWTKPR